MTILPKHLTLSQSVFSLRKAEFLNHEIEVVVPVKGGYNPDYFKINQLLPLQMSRSGWIESLSEFSFGVFYSLFFKFFGFFLLSKLYPYMTKTLGGANCDLMNFK